MKKKKNKVVWLCTFSNEEKRAHIRLWRKGRLEWGQWIPNMLRAFETDDTLELHVISTDDFMVDAVQTWTERNITYHCFKSGIPILGHCWPARFPVDHMTNFWLNRRRIKKLIRQLNPDLIHLFGVENPEYGAAALDLLKDYPVFVTIQGFIHRQRHYHDTLVTRVRCRYEEILLRACSLFSGDYESETLVRSFNPEASYRHLYFPVNEELISRTPVENDKPFDLLFVGKRTAQKGFGDYLEIVRRLAAVKPDLVAAVVGHAGDYPPAMELISKNRIESNIRWLGQFPSQEGLFKVYGQSKLFLAPTYNDCFPSTIRESMLLGTAVIAYATGGIPWANRDGRNNIVLVDQGDVEGMADAARQMLEDKPTRTDMTARAKLFAEQEFSLRINAVRIRTAYQEEIGGSQ